MSDHLTPAAEALGPTTRAGWALLGREALNSRSFTLISAADILAIESEARATADARIAALTAEVRTLHYLIREWSRAEDPYTDEGDALADYIANVDRAALTPPAAPAPAASGERCGFRWTDRYGEHVCGFPERDGIHMTDHPFQPAEPEGGAA